MSRPGFLVVLLAAAVLLTSAVVLVRGSGIEDAATTAALTTTTLSLATLASPVTAEDAYRTPPNTVAGIVSTTAGTGRVIGGAGGNVTAGRAATPGPAASLGPRTPCMTDVTATAGISGVSTPSSRPNAAAPVPLTTVPE